ncbi:MAG TPA: type VI secretion system baseplate subunit TssF [Thermoanaerobaculia bacterium]|jgi:type VI secretion system protein ImpG|nr:type VI secretion system baseplate subunit TssF [Thermoanaerobaculia bacterium]
MRAPGNDFLRYYLEELSYLREMGQQFARSYPKVASRLELQPGECPDPHVERLIESFAFLTARIQNDLDSDFPEIAAELLDVLYPHYLRPVPSMAVARFDFDPERAKLTTGFEIEKHTQLFAVAEQGAVCRMRTCYPVTLWPVKVTRAEMEVPELFDFLGSDVAAVLRLRLESLADPFEVLGVDKLRFYLHGDPVLVSRVYELMLRDTIRVAVVPHDAKSHSYLPKNSLAPVGLEDDEEVIPYPRHSHPAYRLLQEYFAFPEKFHFVDVSGLAGRASGQSIDLLFLLDRASKRRLLLTPETFSLGCTPIANLYRKTTEPIRIDQRQIEYRLVGDMRKERTTEIHSIVAVSGSSNEAETSREYAPFYSFTHGMEMRKQKAFWHARRVPASREDLTGTDVLLSFRDLEFRPTFPPEEIVFAHTLCTNRELAVQLPADAKLQTDESIPASIVCVKKPTRPIDPPLGGQALWRLVSHLSLNHLSLTEERESLRALHEILGLYCFAESPAHWQQIRGIQAMAQRRIMRRAPQPDWKGFARGTEVTLNFNEENYAGSSAFLLASVLSRFFGLHASTNSFTQLVMTRVAREGESNRWPPMAGGRAVL